MWLRRAVWLSWFTIFYNLVEGIVSIAFGAGEESLALFGFGVDSFIEVFSAALVLWRLRGGLSSDRKLELQRERRAVSGIGILFVVLSLGVSGGAVLELLAGSHPSTTVPGVIISLVSLSFMYFLYRAKLTVARELDSETVRKDAACSLACIQLSLVLLVGSAVFWIWPGLWWVDSLAALGLAAMILREGLESIRAARAPDFSGGCGCGGCH